MGNQVASKLDGEADGVSSETHLRRFTSFLLRSDLEAIDDNNNLVYLQRVIHCIISLSSVHVSSGSSRVKKEVKKG